MANYPNNCQMVGNPYSYGYVSIRFGEGSTTTFHHWRNRFTAADYYQGASTPVGYGPGAALVLAQSFAGMATTPADAMTSDGELSGDLWATRQLAATLVSANTLTANAGLVTALAATMLSANTTSASLNLTLSLAANMASAGNISASLSAIAFCVAEMTNPNVMSSSNMTGVARMEANLTTEGTVVTASSCAAAVWNALAAAFNNPATMGALMNSPGGITPQTIRDAMALATAETIDPGSIDDKLNKIKANTNLIPAAL